MNHKVYITKKGSNNTHEWAFDNHTTGTITDGNQDLKLPAIYDGENNNELLEYSKIEAITLAFGASRADYLKAKKLEDFGIKVKVESEPSPFLND